MMAKDLGAIIFTSGKENQLGERTFKLRFAERRTFYSNTQIGNTMQTKIKNLLAIVAALALMALRNPPKSGRSGGGVGVKNLFLLVIYLTGVGNTLAAQADDYPLYELRTYHTNPGKMDALNTRFRDHTLALIEKHGMRNVFYWSPADQPNTLIYVVAHQSAEAADASWKAFASDSVWIEVYQASIADGVLVRQIESVFMTKTDYSP